MKFLIQWNLINEEQLQKIKVVIDKFPHEYVSVTPFTHEITPNQHGVNYIPYGSVLMTNISLERGYTGLSFDLDTFNYESFYKNRRDMLNGGNIRTAKEIIDYFDDIDVESKSEKYFVKPSLDLKQFSGMVDTGENIQKYLKDAMQCASSGSYKIDEDTMIVLDDVKVIQAEWRYFIVDRKIVSGSMYRCNGQMRIKEELDIDVLEEAQQFADGWLPHDNCVMDLALVDGKLKVIEFNCINSSGFYDNNVENIIKSLWEYYNK